MQIEIDWRDEANRLIALHGSGAISALVGRISDAVRRCDDQAVDRLDYILQLVEARLERPWRRMPIRFAEPGASTLQTGLQSL